MGVEIRDQIIHFSSVAPAYEDVNGMAPFSRIIEAATKVSAAEPQAWIRPALKGHVVEEHANQVNHTREKRNPNDVKRRRVVSKRELR
jgi:hypothetical protein